MNHGIALSALIVALAGFAPAPALPQAPPSGNRPGSGVMVTPTRLVFSSRQRMGEVTLLNPGAVPGTFRISLVRMEMDENGACRQLPLEPVPGQVAVQDMIRFSPKLVTLKAKESQVVRIQLRRPADLPAGEYRLHMVFREVPPLEPEAEAGIATQAPTSLKVRLAAVFGVAIPLIIRQGETSVTATLANLALDADAWHLRFRVERQGNQSLHGNFTVRFKPDRGPVEQVAEANGMSVFTPLPFRNVILPLKPRTGPWGKGRFTVTYAAPADQGGALLAEASLDVL